jgi:hypothetical protein
MSSWSPPLLKLQTALPHGKSANDDQTLINGNGELRYAYILNGTLFTRFNFNVNFPSLECKKVWGKNESFSSPLYISF